MLDLEHSYNQDIDGKYLFGSSSLVLNVLLNIWAQVIQALLAQKSCVKGPQPPLGCVLFGVLVPRKRCLKLSSLEAKSNAGLNCLAFVQYGALDRAIEILF